MIATKLFTAKLVCESCNDVSYLDIYSNNEDSCYTLCVACNQLYYVYNDPKSDSIVITRLCADEAVDIFKQEENYRHHVSPMTIRKTKTMEQYIDGLR
jgi:hypothetical protein